MLNGVQFKKGALVFLFADSFHRDPKVWTNPEEFNPDRCSQCEIVLYQYIIVLAVLHFSSYIYIAYKLPCILLCYGICMHCTVYIDFVEPLT